MSWCLDVLMSCVLDLGNVIGSPGSCLARVRFRTTQELTIDRQLLLGLHQLRQLLIWYDTKIASHVCVVGPNDCMEEHIFGMSQQLLLRYSMTQKLQDASHMHLQ